MNNFVRQKKDVEKLRTLIEAPDSHFALSLYTPRTCISCTVKWKYRTIENSNKALAGNNVEKLNENPLFVQPLDYSMAP